jgi:hypothetical protein
MQFIKSYKLFDDEYCDKVVKMFEHQKRLGCSVRRDDHARRDNQIEFNSSLYKEQRREKEAQNVTVKEWDEIDFRNDEVAILFFEKISEGVKKYTEDLGITPILGEFWFKNMLIQSYDADKYESYSAWHCEAAHRDSCDRAIVYTLYLNDDFEGGETEFMHQKHREKPETGKIVFWPAGYTHTHRGAMLLSGKKYIATGWVFF